MRFLMIHIKEIGDDKEEKGGRRERMLVLTLLIDFTKNHTCLLLFLLSTSHLTSPILLKPKHSLLVLIRRSIIDLTERVRRTTSDGLPYVVSAPRSYPVAFSYPALLFPELATELDGTWAYSSVYLPFFIQ